MLAGFYSEPLVFAFPPAFMREARIRVAAEWQPSRTSPPSPDWSTTGALSLDGLITHRLRPQTRPTAYRTAFDDPACLKMILDWRDAHDASIGVDSRR